MPIYEYNCPACGKQFEALVKVGQTPACPQCGDANPERQFSLSAGISTNKTRSKATSKARQRSGAIKKEQDHAHAEYLRNHELEHRNHD